MTREAFIKVLDERGYTYEIVGGKIIITHTYVGSGAMMKDLTSLPPGVVFSNEGDVSLDYLLGGNFTKWKGHIEGIDSKRLLNLMIKQGLFER